MIKKCLIKDKPILYSTILISILLVLGFIILFYSYSKIDSLNQLQNKVMFNDIISKAIHSLQRERGLSTGSILTDNEKFKIKLEEQRVISDKDIHHLIAMQTHNNSSKKLFHKFLLKHKNLVHIRSLVDNKKYSFKQILDYYSELNSILLETVVENTKAATLNKNNNIMQAYINFLYLKEYVGIERALGVIIFSKQKIDNKTLYKFLSLLELQKFNKKMFLQNIDSKIYLLYKKFHKNSSIFNQISDIEKKLESCNDNNISIKPIDWYNAITIKIDHLSMFSKKIKYEIEKNILYEKRISIYIFIGSIILTSLSILFFIILIRNIFGLLKQEKNLRTILDQYVINAQIDTNTNIKEASEAFCSISKYNKTELTNMTMTQLLDMSEQESIVAEIKKNLKNNSKWSGKLKNIDKEGHIYYTFASIVPLADDRFLYINLDITQSENLLLKLKEEEKKRKIQQQMLQYQYRLAKIGETLNMIAHQWRQPLNVISLTTSIIKLKAQQNILDNKLAIELSDKIKSFAMHLSHTIDDFRNFYKPNKEKILTDFKSIMEKIDFIMKDSLEQNNVTLKIDTKEVTTFSSYENELKQAIINIIKNAEEALVNNNIKNPTIMVEIDKKSIIISDNATGIDKDIEEKIFEPYFSTKYDKNGTGLGLYMCKIIVEEHCKGTLSLINSPSGATFKIDLGKKND